jgi:ribosome-associated protein YbcJ (S4-like RNA binding protein)
MKRGKQEKSGIKVERRRKKVESGNLILIKGQIIVEKVKTDKDIEIVNL